MLCIKIAYIYQSLQHERVQVCVLLYVNELRCLMWTMKHVVTFEVLAQAP